MAFDEIFIILLNIHSGGLVHRALRVRWLGDNWLRGRVDFPGNRWRRGRRTTVLNGDLCIHMHAFGSTRGFHRSGTPLSMPFGSGDRGHCFGVLVLPSGIHATPQARMMSMQLGRNRWNNCPGEGGRRKLNSLFPTTTSESVAPRSANSLCVLLSSSSQFR